MQRWTSLFWVAGRLKRRPYWLGVLSLLIASLAAQILAQAVGPALGPPIYTIVQAAVSWVAVCLFSQRLHDLGRPAWMQIPGLALIVLGFGAAQPAAAAALHLDATGRAISVMVGLAGYFGLIIALGLVRGTDGPNRYGAS